MIVVVRFISILMIGMGITFVIRPEYIRKLFAFCSTGKRLYFMAGLRCVIGVLILLVASEGEITGLLILLGIFFLAAGIIIFILGVDKSKSIISWWRKKSNLSLRGVSIIPVILGIVLLYAL